MPRSAAAAVKLPCSAALDERREVREFRAAWVENGVGHVRLGTREKGRE